MENQFSYSWTQEKNDLKEWDTFLKNDSRGQCQQVSHYLKSFTTYPFFSYQVLIVRNSCDKIVGGIGVVIVGIPLIKLVIAPLGPIISLGFEPVFEPVIIKVLEKAKKIKAFYCQIKAPLLAKNDKNFTKFAMDHIPDDSIYYSGKVGSKFPLVKGVDGFRVIQFNSSQVNGAYELVRRNFNKNTKRNIKKAYNNQLELKYAQTENELCEAYEIIEEVAAMQKYSLRSWPKMKVFLMSMLEDDLCIVPCCYRDGKMKGALIVFLIGQRMTYVYGGVRREESDLKVGHFLHNEMLLFGIKEGYRCYDFGVAGNMGVTRFKEGFGAKNTQIIEARYWFLLKTKLSSFQWLKA